MQHPPISHITSPRSPYPRFDNDRDSSESAEKMYVAELREFRDYFMQHTTVEELKSLNLLGLQFALCEATTSMAGRFEGERQHVLCGRGAVM